MTQTISLQGEEFILHPSGAIYWQAQTLLLISDVHLGKVSHFRKFGAAVPASAIRGNFEMLGKTIDFFNPQKVCFLGDLFHSYLNGEWGFFEAWVQNSNLEIILVSGNHDIISPLKFHALGIAVVPEIEMQGFLLTHHPEERTGFFNFSGHLHPAIKLRGKGRQSLRLPCFYLRKMQLILPAFGAFTGTHVMEMEKDHEAFAIADAMVIKI